MNRTDNCLAKLERMNKALHHKEPDRVPISDFFWGSFIKRWRNELNLPDSAEPYRYYDLDWIVTTPNMDPTIRPFETIRENEIEVVVKTGFGATLRKALVSRTCRYATAIPGNLSTKGLMNCISLVFTIAVLFCENIKTLIRDFPLEMSKGQRRG